MARIHGQELHILEFLLDHEQNGVSSPVLPTTATKLGSPAEVRVSVDGLVATGMLHRGGAEPDDALVVTVAGRAAVSDARARASRRRMACRDQLLAWVTTAVDSGDGQPVSRSFFDGSVEGEPFTDREVAMAALFLDDAGLIGGLDAPGAPNLLVWPTGPGRDCLLQGGVAAHLAAVSQSG